MANADPDCLFLDTSIQIARFVHGPRTKEHIKTRIQKHSRTATGLIARQEFKRRLLVEAEYLLRLLHKYKSYDEVNQHIIRLFGQWPGRIRKRNICLQTLAQVHGGADPERTERLQLYLRSLLVTGLNRFDQQVDELRKESGCACAEVEVTEKVVLRKYELGPKHCSRIKSGQCKIRIFLEVRRQECGLILQKLKTLTNEQSSAELKKTQEFLERLMKSPDQVCSDDPCLTVGDLLIALESVGIGNFFTLNSAESQYLCRALGQSLIVRSLDPLKEEIICRKDDPEWPRIGKKSAESD